MAKPAGEKVPKQMQGKFEEITNLTDAFGGASWLKNKSWSKNSKGLKPCSPELPQQERK